MDKLPKGIEVRGKSIRIHFMYKGVRCRPTLKGLLPTSKNIALAEQKRNAVLYEIQSGKFDYSTHFPDCKHAKIFSPNSLPLTTVKEAIHRWLARKERTTAKSTFRGYQSKASHVTSRWGDILIKDIQKTDIDDWLDVELHHLSNKTINDVLIVFRGALADYKEENPSFSNPLERIPNKKLNDQDIDPFTLEEIRKIVETPTDRISERNLIEFAIWTGLSVSEVIALAWEDVSIERREISVNRARVEKEWKVPKERRRKRTLELTDQAMDVLCRQREITESSPAVKIDVTQADNKTRRVEVIRPVFLRTTNSQPFPCDFTVRDRFFKTHLKKADVRYRGPNNCRHTYASQMLTSGLPKTWVAEQLGHSNTDMIDRHYGKWIKEDAPGMAALASKLISERAEEMLRLSQERPIG